MFDNSQNKTFKYLVLGAIIVVLAVLIYELFLKPKPLALPEIILPSAKVEIDFSALENPELKELLDFEQTSLPETIGRQNPFTPY